MSTEPVPFTKDKSAMLLVGLSSLLAFINVFVTAIRLKSHDFKVPVQYVVHDGSVLQTSNWYTLFSLALFSVAGVASIIFLAHRLHKSSRIFATGILVVCLIIQIITLLVTNALLGLVGRV